jgi:hypothetical protein
LIGILDGPLSGLLDGTIGVSLPEVSDLLVQGVIEVGCGKEGLNREEHGSDLQSGAPLVLQDVETDSACKYAKFIKYM